MKKLFTSLAALLLSAGLSYGQGTISGTVSSMATGTMVPVPNYRVYVIFDSTAAFHPAHQDAYTNASGMYTMSMPANMPTGFHFTVYCADSCSMMIASGGTQSYAAPGMYNMPFFICMPNTPQGKVTLGTTGNPAANATVYCIQKCSSGGSFTLTAIDSTTANANGDYAIPHSLPTGTGCTFLLKAALPASSSNYSAYLPTYFTSSAPGSLTWANAMNLSAPNFIHENFALNAGTNPGGPGFIGGSVLQGANKGTAVGDPLNKRILILTTQADVPVAYAYSDATGKFSFSNIAYGTYKVFGDALGKLNPPFSVTISATKPSVNNIVFEENSSKFEAHTPSAINEVSGPLAGMSVYPNPVRDQLYIGGLDNINGEKHITLLRGDGAIVFSQSTTSGQLSIPMQSFASGLYLLRVQTNEGTAAYRVRK